ncbi:hypothetical protein A3H80_02350 [Candidatus Roizmanbacteria bacterium RIFCSPLOWO2_02_FULL_37_19]|uniref:Peptidase S11 D-alanyl-D-alanine carboxypeptidase A N-terminal domain-containing protein n=1 Tax=Candidatus Roizmanbacteria bacterium RIFCSPHIGHO2_02_FULL_37_24 TaxID=1802037 RepID=A0A1F7H012_9BACT|nr:MAG: hypothetical protein A2862_02970 [Candidatus Roizmanbacteria bacterium RIFCSPHIGHO2_01_FULL_38_41]OGK24720.1 MAG: hypothetical protein A3C24_01190 [Candidatus Roizmanbacteria bacterium RIFCSPHIGHO2_02_FULL_37_24]OGK32896.1 MAG: hypothetical protein A3E10_02935 [Candidatus Roizmanbacteria bacterium RIFCSPHIGHO2_12_FULL_37_23]OGK44111.1 MAG: hypothetical protein A2956_03615 [Candidatus Roizmanbacteria bacterium RIFCSPLOWO2_01_FULL_37_57]OGK54382.1 MAG: hypothetical protein A3H80_02350 [Ca
MSRKTHRESKKTSTLTWFQLRTFLLFSFFSLFFLFYPGNSYYLHFFSYHRDLFASESTEQTIYEVGKIPYIINTTIKPEISAQGAYIVDLSSATPVFEKNIENKFLPASVTKVITALTAFDAFQLEDVLEVKRVINIGQTADLIIGEKMTFENLLYAVLIHSGNDAAYVIADNYPGGYDVFIDAMNKKTLNLQMKNSHFENPAGLDSFKQYSTPFDLSLAGRALLQNKTLSKIVSTKSITVSDVDFRYFHPLYNINRLLGEIPGVGGLKTGKTEEAGENLITFYKHNGFEYLIVLMKSEDRFTDTENIVGWINSNIGYTQP